MAGIMPAYCYACLCFAAYACSHCQACWPLPTLDEMLVSLSAVNSWFLTTFGAVKQQFVLETAGSFRNHIS